MYCSHIRKTLCILFYPYRAFKCSHSLSRSRMNLTLNNKLREFCMRLRKLVDEGKSDEEIFAEKNAMVEQIYRIVSICLGTPPEVSMAL